MDDFILTSTLVSIAKLAMAITFLCLFGAAAEKVFGFDMEGAIDALEKNAQDGNALPLAIVLAALAVTFGGILQRFL